MNVSIRYAKAFFQIAAQKNMIEQFMRELNLLKRIFSDVKEVKEVFEDRLIDKSRKINVFSNICREMELSQETSKLIILLINKRREDIYDDMTASYEQLYDDYKGIVRVDVYTAYDISSNELEGLKARIKNLFGKDPILSKNKDSSIIGGVKLKVGWTIYDGSIKTHLKDFTNSIKI